MKDINEIFSIQNRTALITGSSRGIGLSIAKAFAQYGANVVISSRKAEACDEAAKEIRDSGGSAISVPAHAGELGDMENLVSQTADSFGGIDILINNAANALAMQFGEMTESAWDKSLGVNLKGPVFLIQSALPHLKASPHASVINISSAAGFLFSGKMHMYAAGKAGLQSYTRSLAGELAEFGIRVNCIAPGTIDTDMVRNNTIEAQESMAKASLMGRAAHPDEVVGLALYLASDAASFMTGATLNLDGGLVAR